MAFNLCIFLVFWHIPILERYFISKKTAEKCKEKMTKHLKVWIHLCILSSLTPFPKTGWKGGVTFQPASPDRWPASRVEQGRLPRKSGWWQLKHVLFSVLFGRMIQFLLFQMGWNHLTGFWSSLLDEDVDDRVLRFSDSWVKNASFKEVASTERSAPLRIRSRRPLTRDEMLQPEPQTRGTWVYDDGIWLVRHHVQRAGDRLSLVAASEILLGGGGYYRHFRWVSWNPGFIVFAAFVHTLLEMPTECHGMRSQRWEKMFAHEFIHTLSQEPAQQSFM